MTASTALLWGLRGWFVRLDTVKLDRLLSMRQKSWQVNLFFISMLLTIAAVLRFTNLGDNPSWYTDEGTHLEIARQLQYGRFQYLAITQSTLLFARPPLFDLLLAAAVRVFGLSMATLRYLTAGLGVISVGLVYGGLRRWENGRLSDNLSLLPVFAAFILAIYPQAVLYSRFGFSYNLLAPLLLLMVYGLYSYSESGDKRNLALAASAVGLGIVSDLWMISVVPVLLLVTVWRSWRDAAWSMALVCAPFGVYTAVSLLTIPTAFLFDLQFTLFRLAALTLPQQLQTVALNVTTLFTQDIWLAIGVMGLFLIRPYRLRYLLLLTFLLPLLILGRTTALYSLGAYYMIPLLPLLAVGWGAWLQAALHWGQRQPGLLLPLLFAVLLIPLGTTLFLDWQQAQQVWSTSIDPFLLRGADAQAVAIWVNGRIQPDDLVIASPGITWLLQGHRADFQMAVAIGGQATPHLPADIPADRYEFDPTFARARYVIVDDLWRHWAVYHVPGLSAQLAEVEQWPLLFSAGAIFVYANPAFPAVERYRLWHDNTTIMPR